MASASEVVDRPEVVLKRPQVEQRTALSRSKLYALVKAGEFPAPIRLGIRAVGWLSSEVETWIADRTKASRAV